jgi:hypothetical protein
MRSPHTLRPPFALPTRSRGGRGGRCGRHFKQQIFKQRRRGQVLGVARDADEGDLKKAYRKVGPARIAAGGGVALRRVLHLRGPVHRVRSQSQKQSHRTPSRIWCEAGARSREASTPPGPHCQAALRLHPDKCQLDGAKEAFQKLSSAFGCLSEPDERAYYDHVGSERSASAVGPAGPGRIVAHPL